MIPQKFHTFVDGKTPAGLITAERLNENFDALYDMFDPAIVGIDYDNIKTPSKILVSDRNYTGAYQITGTFQFSAFPTVPDASIPDAKLSTNIPKKDLTNAFSAKQTFNAGIDLAQQQAEQIVIHKLAAAPGSPVSGQVYYNTTNNKYYGWNGSAWNQMDYVGGYTGGAVLGVSFNVLVDDGDPVKVYFKTSGATPTVKILIKGEPYPKRFYTELGYHTHVFTGVTHAHSVTDPGHTHSVVIGAHDHDGNFGLSTHTHNISGNTGNESGDHAHYIQDHTHTGVTTGANSTGNMWDYASKKETSGTNDVHHTHSISATSSGPSASGEVDSRDLGTKVSASGVTGISVQNTIAEGANSYAGINAGSLSSTQKLYAKSLAVKIDGVTVTSYILTATGWSVIGDGTGSHAFHTAGTGDMDASAWKSYAAGFHIIEITEPEGGYGSSVLIYVETY